MTFIKHFKEILERCNHKFHRPRTLVSKKWGPSPTTILQIYKQCVRPIFEYGIGSTITVSDSVINKIQRVQNSFIRVAFRLPKYVSACLIHEASALPYVRERLNTVGQNHLARMHANPLVEHTINSSRTNIAWDKHKTGAYFTILETINHMLERGSKVFGCFLDVRKAFDTVWIDGLLYKLFTELGIEGKMWLAIKDLYTDVKARVLLSGTLSRIFDISQGTGQGRILAPFLYKIT